MSYLDLLILLVVIAAAVGGYRLGFLARGGGWLGLLVGLAVAALLVEPVVSLFDGSDQLVRLMVAITVFAVLTMVGQSIGMTAGDRLRRTLPGSLRDVDRGAGALAGVFGALVVLWLFLPTLAVLPGEVARVTRDSAIIGFVDEAAPPPPALLRELGNEISDFAFPQVFDDMRPAPDPGPAPSEMQISPALLGELVGSTMNVEALGCGRIQEGSAFVVEQELVATNAHVVAGTESIEVLLDDGTRFGTTLVAFDPARDVALLQVPGLARAPLPLATAVDGSQAAIFGYPGGQDDVRVAPAVVAGSQTAIGRDIYGSGLATREILVLAAELRPGDSGSAVVDPAGNVVGIAFAIAPDRSSTAYALTSAELATVIGGARSTSTSTGACI